LNALVNWERRDKDASMRRGLEPIRDILRRMGNPERKWRAVHVAGTKGKGTTSALIATALAQAGVHVGLYTSPHVSRIHERIRIDGRDVDDATLASALERSLAAREQALAEHEGTIAKREQAIGAHEQAIAKDERAIAEREHAGAEATWFDLITAAAFSIFADERVEWAVVECGLGGRLDSTNVIDGEVCVITNIDLEHTAVLGSTRAAIAREKAGILKRGSTLVTGVLESSSDSDPEDDVAGVMRETAHSLGVRVLRPASLAPTMLDRNVDLARLALDELGRRGVRTRDGKTFSRDMLDARAIESARLPARSEKLWSGTTRVVLDGAHVASSVKMVLNELALDPDLATKPIAVLALGRDKDVGAILKTLAGRVDRLVCTTAASGPLLTAESLAHEATRAGIAAETASDPSRAFARALDLAQPERWVLVIGSFYLAGALRSNLHTESSA
jgi:dihydrofolate synthase/folylpolyglutamate synthase